MFETGDTHRRRITHVHRALQWRERDHFLALASRSSTDQIFYLGLFRPSGPRGSVLTRYFPSATWAWLVCNQEQPAMIFYNDV